MRTPLLRPILRASALVLPQAGCTGTGAQDVLDPAGPHAEQISWFFWTSTAIAVLVYAAFAALLLHGLLRAARRQRRGEENELPPSRGRHLVLWGGLVGPTLILLALLVLSAYTDRRISRLGRSDSALSIEVVGHQFWWEVRYLNPSRRDLEFTTANEIHVPVGRPVKLILHSRDVIHSFWMPSLNGKMDLIPGRTNDLVIRADEPGVFRGQCAEFCGTQHAKMGVLLVAHPPEAFEAWRTAQLRPQGVPADPEARRGQEVFLRNGCALCHSVRGTEAHGRVAPDLTHFATRQTIAAGTLPNTRGHLAGWIADPQGVKPGSRMPAVPLEGDDLRALLTYLHSLR